MALGKTLKEIDQLSEQEYAEWEMYYQEQPFGQWREDYRTAQISHLLAIINRDSKANPPNLSDFMPFFNDKIENNEDDGAETYLKSRLT
ncbi:MAG: DUF4035 domain-containing protein [[Actinobacillus] rossii]|uniref:Phage protein n=1 Tax=[Actinobacillus] rossii TaxID=123820 RepID=A0A380U0L4_9PAST|nr:DUF4035 domain-containing protein [[Actinobacillus] rossii]MDD7426089.1 DUF4035 domain-containing protein [[Actinobacillus] rossii]MDY3124533.1 DUF4035 domain-containing protein [[Actinobacillus] rossii]MDY4505485.1 DUF4035 domain-containing protein [[Actinobacillus] rossii]SUT93627.1 phage protein [[Actinobacillus] rossii]